MVEPALTLEDLEVDYDSSDQSSYSMDSTGKATLIDMYSQFYQEMGFKVCIKKEKNIMVVNTVHMQKLVSLKTKAALIELYSQFYREMGFKVCIKKEKNIMVVNTVYIQKLVRLKFPSDMIIFPKTNIENELIAPHVLFQVIIGYNTPSVVEMILGMMNFEQRIKNELKETKIKKSPHTIIIKKEEITDFNNVRTGKVNYKKLPFIIIFNRCDLFNINSANDFLYQWKGFMSIIWSQDILKEAYNEDKFQKEKKEKDKMSAENVVLKEGFTNILISEKKKIIEVLNENSVRTTAMIEEERKNTIEILESLFEKQLEELRRLMN